MCKRDNLFGTHFQEYANLSKNGMQDQPWSAQDERQIRGRAHRQPQTKEVLIYHLLANDTADIVLSEMARGKHDMLEAFLSKQSNKGRFLQRYSHKISFQS
jgi:SNF2 family DNA or RNA helicase